MSVTVVGVVELEDDRIGRHLRHHDRYAQPSPSGRWAFRVVRLPVSELYCPYDDPGVREPNNPAGLMGSIGLARAGYRGVRIADMAARLEEVLTTGNADLTNPALKCVLDYRDRGPAYIYQQDQPLVVFEWYNRWAVREGVHRSVALALLRVETIEAFDFDSGTVRG